MKFLLDHDVPEDLTYRVDRQGREEPIKAPPRDYMNPRLSPDGTRIAVDVNVNQERDIWIWQTTRETLTRLTFGLGRLIHPLDGNPIWSGDGTRILFTSHHDDEANLFWQLADGTGQAERLTKKYEWAVCNGHVTGWYGCDLHGNRSAWRRRSHAA